MTIKNDTPDLAKCIEDLDKRLHDLTKKVEGAPAPEPKPKKEDPPPTDPPAKEKHEDHGEADCIICQMLRG